MPKESRLYSETIRLERPEYLELKLWLIGKTDYNDEQLTKKVLHQLVIRTFLSRKDWQQVILNHLDLKRSIFKEAMLG